MIPVSGRTDVVAQWFSGSYVKEHKKVFSSITAGPGELIVLVKDGKPVDTYTESRIRSLGADSIWKRLSEWFGNVETQIITVNLTPFAIRLPFSGYTSDRTEIKGVLNSTVHLSKDNIIRLTNLFKRDLVTDSKWGSDMGKLKEVTKEDIENILTYDTSLTLDATILSQMASSELRDNMNLLNAKIKNAVDKMAPVWVSSGLCVDVVKAEVEENLYEDVMRDRDQHHKAQMVMDTAFETKAHEMELGVDYAILCQKKSVEEELNRVMGELQIADYKLDHSLEEEMKLIEHNIDVDRKKKAAELENATTKAEIDRINNVSEDEKRRMEIATQDYAETLKIKRDEYVKSEDHKRQMEILVAKANITEQEWYNAGKEEGKKVGDQMMFQNGFNQGYTQGLLRAIDSGGFTRVEHAPQGYPAQPQYYQGQPQPQPQYYQAPPPQPQYYPGQPQPQYYPGQPQPQPQSPEETDRRERRRRIHGDEDGENNG